MNSGFDKSGTATTMTALRHNFLNEENNGDDFRLVVRNVDDQ